MKKYTVVLLRPDRYAEACEATPMTNTYVAHVSAKTMFQAYTDARAEALAVDKREGTADHMAQVSDYTLVVLFEGHINPLLFGWQV